MSNTKQIIMVGLTIDQWDFLISDMDVRHVELESEYKRMKGSHPKETLDSLKYYAHSFEEIINEIADQLCGVTEEMEN